MLNMEYLENSQTLTDINFFCFALVVSAVPIIQLKLSRLIDFIGLNRNGSIDFSGIGSKQECIEKSLFIPEKNLLLIAKVITKSKDDEINTI